MKRTLFIFTTTIFVGMLTMCILVPVHGQTPTSPQHITPAAIDGKQAAGKEVVIDNFTFTPATLSIAAGTQVTWTDRDDIPHNVVNTDKKFKSTALDTNESFSYIFTEPGTYEYFCSIHPKMTAKIVVEKK